MEPPATDATAPVTPPPAAPVTSPKATPKTKAPAHFEDADGLFKTVCRSFMAKRCAKTECVHVHDPQLCSYFWKTGACKFGAECKKNHFVTVGAKAETNGDQNADAKEQPPKNNKKKEKKPKEKKTEKTEDASATTVDESGAKKEEKKTDKKNKKNDKKPKDENAAKPKLKTVKGKNTECFEPMTKPVDVRITYDLGSATDKFSTSLTSRDILLAPNIFSDFKKGELYDKLLKELENCGIPEERLLKMWHGNDKLDGTHLIADDKTRWKTNCPTFQLVIDRIQKFFKLKVQATRFNWYKDTSQWKPFHFDAAAVKPDIAAKQNFTVGVSFGATRDAAFEHAQTRTVVSIPQPDSCVYAFARDTNIIWRHGILQDVPVRQEGRISVIAWGWIDGMVDPLDTVEPTQ